MMSVGAWINASCAEKSPSRFHLLANASFQRAHLQQRVYPWILEGPIEVLEGQDAEATLKLIRGSGAMSAAEHAAFAFIERRLPGPDDNPYQHADPEPPTEDERSAIKALVSYYIGCQK